LIELALMHFACSRDRHRMTFKDRRKMDAPGACEHAQDGGNKYQLSSFHTPRRPRAGGLSGLWEDPASAFDQLEVPVQVVSL
jgi:hypothetical protein